MTFIHQLDLRVGSKAAKAAEPQNVRAEPSHILLESKPKIFDPIQEHFHQFSQIFQM